MLVVSGSYQTKKGAVNNQLTYVRKGRENKINKMKNSK
jgi:hypothetical protein